MQSKQLPMKRYLILLAGWLLSNFALADNTRLDISAFASEQLQDWQTKVFQGETDYQILDMDGRSVLRATSNGTASGLFKEQRIDLHKTPYLNWQWRIESRLTGRNEQEKEGDDYAARIYVVVDGGWKFWNTKAINYVWAGSSPKDAIWPNAFAGKSAMMIALRSADDPLNTWQREKRNILKDLQRFYGDKIRYIDAVAIMTDTDNAGGEAIAFYADIYFSED